MSWDLVNRAKTLVHQARDLIVTPDASKGPMCRENDPPPPAKATDDQQAANVRAFANRANDVPPPPTMCEMARNNRHDELETLDGSKLRLFLANSPAAKDGIELGDVQQGRLDDCYLLAPMAALANTAKGRALLHSMIKETPAGYQVKLPGMGKTVTVSKTTFGKDRAHFGTESIDRKQEVWPLVIESAFAQAKGGYTSIGNCGTLADGMGCFTKSSAVVSGSDPGLVDRLSTACKQEQPAVLVTKTAAEMNPVPDVSDESGVTQPLPVEHMMAVVSVDARGTVKLYDTTSGSMLFLPKADFARCVGEACIATL